MTSKELAIRIIVMVCSNKFKEDNLIKEVTNMINEHVDDAWDLYEYCYSNNSEEY